MKKKNQKNEEILEADPIDENQENDENFEVDSIDENSDSENLPKVREEVKRLTPKQVKAEKKALAKEKKKQDIIKYKKIKKHRKMIRKNPSNLVRYDPEIDFGLSTEIIEERVLDELVNKTVKKTTKSVGKILYTNIVTFFNILIFFIAGCLISVRAPITDFAFLLIVVINITIGIIQEIRAKKMIESLQLMNASYVKVRRNGVVKEIPVDEVVLDEILIFENGNQICTDSIVLEGQVEVNESLLTGESDAIIKKPGDVLLSGSFIVSGTCVARADKVGKDNYIENLSSQAKVYKKPKSDLLISLNRIIKFMTFPVVIIGGVIFVRMFLKLDIVNLDTLQNPFRKTAGAMIGMIPSGLFLMSSIALYVGVIKLGKKNVLVQELYCIEMLARVNCICLDKTGTITDGTMVVKDDIEYESVHGLVNRNIVSAILNAMPDRNMTSEALINKYGDDKQMDVVSTIPFSSQRKYQAVTFDKYGTFILGAPEFILVEDFEKIKEDVDKYAKAGFRVLALVHRQGEIKERKLPEKKNTVLSLILIEDNIRPDAINTIKYFKESGVDVRVISGDNPVTVSMIGQRAGVPNAEKYISLDGLTDQEVKRAALEYTIFGRVSPSQKKIIVQTLKENDKTVAMTGDGVNDILALREADCSIALASGSEATRNCSHLVLLDSNFGSMPSVVSEGRRVINNVTSVASLFLTKTIFSLLLGIIAIIRGDYPISASQLILIDLLSIGIPSLYLVNEPNNNPVTGKFLVNVIRKALPGALVIVMLSLIIFMLSNKLVLDDITSSTILVIVATHTCLMVLFKACHPFNAPRKALCTFCYGMFVLAILIVPQFLEFRPLVTKFEYYSSNLVEDHILNYPDISVSKAGKYVIDGVYTDLAAYNEQTTIIAKYKDEDEDYYYAIKSGENYKITDLKVNIPDVSYDQYGNIYAGGYQIDNLTFSLELEDLLSVDANGYLYYDHKPLTTTLTKSNAYYNYENKYGKTSSYVANYCIMPKVELINGEYLIDGQSYGFKVSSDIMSKFKTDTLSVRLNTTKTENGGYELIVNDSKLVDDEGNVFEVKLPKISTNGNTKTSKNRLYFNASSTGSNVFTVYGDKETINEDQLYYITDKEDNKIYYSTTLNSIVEIQKDEDNNDVIVESTFTFTDFLTSDFKGYYDKNGAEIIVNNDKDSLKIVPKDGETVYYISIPEDSSITTSISLSESSLGPVITISESSSRGNDYYVVNGYITDYEYKGYDLNPKMNSDKYLVIGGVTTDYQLVKDVDYVTVNGGTVRALSIDKLIFLFMLMLLSSPLMKLLQFSVPWLKKQMNNIQDFLNRI
ncbi:MAG: HAD-IC family P-type ATPase [Acholeplasmatales bacterium]|nr:HAD-IC family P-type ATPase [Acholeplasmatales bacterium]